ncbi:Nuclear transport factor 2 [Entamoeba marina]
MSQLQQLAQQFVTAFYNVKTLDVHQIPSNNAVMILIQVVGILSIDGGNPLAFTESFVLTQSGQNWYVLNDIMRLVNF